jgi:hypothetical protein
MTARHDSQLLQILLEPMVTRGKQVTKATWATFLRDAKLALQQCPDGQGKGGTLWHWLMPDGEWLVDPLSADPIDPTIRLPRLQIGLVPVQPLFVDAGTT